jgi:hypothetical protein
MASNTDICSNIVVAWTDEDILSGNPYKKVRQVSLDEAPKLRPLDWFFCKEEWNRKLINMITPIPSISADCLNYKIKRVIFNDPATIVFWDDGTKTVVKCNNGDIYNKEVGLTACIVKKICGNTGRWNEILKKWCNEEDK